MRLKELEELIDLADPVAWAAMRDLGQILASALTRKDRGLLTRM